MVDITKAAQAKSDQLNATDIMGVEPIIRIRDVDYKDGREQPLWIYFDGDNGRPWKPSKGMIRVIIAGWGGESDNFIGKHVKLFFEPSVTYAGKEVGGIQIRAMSDIDPRGLSLVLTLNRKKRTSFVVQKLDVSTAEYPDDKFDKAFPVIEQKLKAGEMTLQQVIAQCQNTGTLSKEQIQRLEKVAPVEVEDEQTPDDIDL